MTEKSKKKRRHERMLVPALSKRVDRLIESARQALWKSLDVWAYTPRSSTSTALTKLGQWPGEQSPVSQASARQRHLALCWSYHTLERSLRQPFTVRESLDRLERNKEVLVERAVWTARLLVGELVMPSNRLAVLERPALTACWPWPLDSVEGALANALIALSPTRLGDEWLASTWPSSVTVAEVISWARPLLDAVTMTPDRPKWRSMDMEQGAPLLDMEFARNGCRLLIPSSALSRLYMLEQEVITAKRMPRLRIDAGQVQQGVIAGHSHLHQTLQRDSIFPKDGTAYSSTHETLEILLPAHHQFGITSSQSAVQLTLPGIPELASLSERIASALRSFYRYIGLRHWTGLLVLLSREGHTGWVRWTLRAALDAMKLAGSPKNRELALEMIELFTKLELTVWNVKKQSRRRNPLVYWKDREETLTREGWEVTGIDLRINPAIYDGCGSQDGSGSNYALAPVELATLETNRWGPAVPLGLQLPARWLYESRRRGRNTVVLSGRELLRLAGLKYEHSPRTWRRLERNLDKLGKIDALGDWSWDPAPALDTRCEIRAPDWMADRTLRKIKPSKQRRTAPDSAMLTGAELMSWRKQNGLTQKQAAECLGVSRRRYGDQERRGSRLVSAQLRRAFEQFRGRSCT